MPGRKLFNMITEFHNISKGMKSPAEVIQIKIKL